MIKALSLLSAHFSQRSPSHHQHRAIAPAFTTLASAIASQALHIGAIAAVINKLHLEYVTETGIMVFVEKSLQYLVLH
jgi:3-methyladenine DNA glycosylase/8-oxoguanine DNA glycosylase